MVTVAEIVNYMEEIAPLALAESWDPIGLQTGSMEHKVEAVHLCLDLTSASLSLAKNKQCQLIITHHPFIFTPLATVRADLAQQRLLYDLIRADISLYSAHTNLDAAVGGVADSLALSLDLPVDNWQTVIPTKVDTSACMGAGHGRYGNLLEPFRLSSLKAHVAAKLGSIGCRINTDQDSFVKKIAVFPGSFSEEFSDSVAELNIDIIITGELKHNIALALAQRGVFAIDAGHDVTERVVLLPLKQRLKQAFPQLTFTVDQGLDYNKIAF